MSTIELMTKPSRWESVLQVMTTETAQLQRAWTPRYRYVPQPYPGTMPKAAAKPKVRRKIVWSRVLMVSLALACASAFWGNSRLERQLQNDQVTYYSHLNP